MHLSYNRKHTCSLPASTGIMHQCKPVLAMMGRKAVPPATALSRLGHSSVYSGHADMLSQASLILQHAQVIMTLIALLLGLLTDVFTDILISLRCRTILPATLVHCIGSLHVNATKCH